MTVAILGEVVMWGVVAWVACAAVGATVLATELLFREWAEWVRWYLR